MILAAALADDLDDIFFGNGIAIEQVLGLDFPTLRNLVGLVAQGFYRAPLCLLESNLLGQYTNFLVKIKLSTRATL